MLIIFHTLRCLAEFDFFLNFFRCVLYLVKVFLNKFWQPVNKYNLLQITRLQNLTFWINIALALHINKPVYDLIYKRLYMFFVIFQYTWLFCINFGKGSEIIIFKSLLLTFEVGNMFFLGGWGSAINWLEPKIKPWHPVELV